MSGWRDAILREFTPGVARLTVAADPDGLLLEAGVLEALRARGFEAVPYDDRIAFRFLYESRYRSRRAGARPRIWWSPSGARNPTWMRCPGTSCKPRAASRSASPLCSPD